MKKVVMLVLAMVLISSLVACSSEEEVEDTQEIQEEEAIEEVVEEVVEEIEEPEIILTYSEENELVFSELSNIEDVLIKTFIGYYEEPYVVEAPSYIEYGEDYASYTIDDITVVESEEEGYIDVIISSTTSVPITVYVDYDYSTSTGGFFYNTNGIGFFDYYTGTVLPGRSTVGDDSYDYSVEIEWEDQVYVLSAIKEQEQYEGDYEWDDYEQNIKVCTNVMTLKHTNTITMPEDYDGLVLCLYYGDANEVEDAIVDEEIDMEISYLLDNDEGEPYTAEDYFCVRIIPEEWM